MEAAATSTMRASAAVPTSVAPAMRASATVSTAMTAAAVRRESELRRAGQRERCYQSKQ